MLRRQPRGSQEPPDVIIFILISINDRLGFDASEYQKGVKSSIDFLLTGGFAEGILRSKVKEYDQRL